MPDLQGKVAIITGASSGIGAGTAVLFAKLGASLSLSGRKQDALEETRKQCLAAGATEDKILITIADVEEKADLEKLVSTTIEKFGRINILVNNAGIVVAGTVQDLSLEDYDRVMSVNTRSVVALTQLALPHILATKGSIVNVSSINGPCSFAGVTFYNMSKAALDQFTKSLALELAKSGVRVNSVNPGVIKTDIHRRAGKTEEQYVQFLEHSKTTHALGRVGEVEEVAKAIAFLASEDASFTTGHLLRIDGGRGIMAPR